ncbi:MAG: SDR family NAD(P)-dependent oxidoreductase [Planctomycetes bacterium]|nr:SDR family NAD(P)-dependent oxidoreductase [Planctomycetota bacterium]
MKVFVTGAGGFIGSHLVETLVERGYEVKASIKYNSKNSWGWLEQIQGKDKVEVVSGDIRDYDFVSDSIKGCKGVFHLAALIGIPYSYVSPLAYIQTKIVGTYNILQASKEHELENILITSTSETYGTAQYVPIDEDHPKVGQSPYSATKISADQLAVSYNKSFGLPVKIVRPFNTYGPRQSARAIIPTIITQLLAGQKEIKLGELSPTRDLLFVKDTANGFVEIAESSGTVGEAINIATQSEISMGDLAQKLFNMVNPEAVVVKDAKRVRPENSEVERLFGKNEKIQKLTNWRQQYDIERGLKETVDWFRNEENLRLYKPDIYNV